MSSSNSTLSATYTSPTNAPFTISHSIPSSSSSTTTPPTTTDSNSNAVLDKTAYLASLRAAVTATQESVNKELTARMEEDKLRDAAANPAAAAAAAKKGVDEDKEEENYGEEVQPEDD
jgi:hypothetical protein